MESRIWRAMGVRLVKSRSGSGNWGDLRRFLVSRGLVWVGGLGFGMILV